jgi:hypothetical protein
VKLTVMYAGGDRFDVMDESDVVVGKLFASELKEDKTPTVSSLSKYQNAKLVIDGKSLKKLNK